MHGWGGSVNSFKSLQDYYSSCGRKTLSVDFPPFGLSQEPPNDWALKDYCGVIIELLDTLKLDEVVFVAHSFGGRVAIMISAMTDRVKGLVLIDSAGLRPRLRLKNCVNKILFAIAKKHNKDTSKYYSDDYNALSNGMKQVFKRIVSDDLSKRLHSIRCPALIIWGKRDSETPLYMGRHINRLIKGSELAAYDGGHYIYLDKHFKVLSRINEFMDNHGL